MVVDSGHSVALGQRQAGCGLRAEAGAAIETGSAQSSASRKVVWSRVYSMTWYGMVWYGMVWYGMVWYGMVWYGIV